MYTYRCIIKRVVDGDTVDVDIDLGFDSWLHDQRIRINGIDAPEQRTSDLVEKHFGQLATEYVMAKLPVGSSQTLISEDYSGKYGRILGDFEVFDHELDRWSRLTSLMIGDHHAVVYRTGDEKVLMEQEHLDNRLFLIQNGISTMTLEEAGFN